MNQKGILIFIAVMFFCMAGCATVYNPVTERNDFIFIGTGEEVALGKNFSQQIEKEMKVSSNPAFINRVQAVGAKIAAVSDRKDLEYHFGVVEDDGINAFALPGGYVYVNSGLLKIADDNELAGVLGHEVCHIAARHTVKATQAQLGYTVVMQVVSATQKSQLVSSVGSAAFNVIRLKYSREDEMLSDTIGAKYAARAGFGSGAMISFLKKLKTATDNKGGEQGILWLRSHPYLTQRIEELERKQQLGLLQ